MDYDSDFDIDFDFGTNLPNRNTSLSYVPMSSSRTTSTPENQPQQGQETLETQEPEETLEQKRANVIEKLNNLVELVTYVRKKKINLGDLNDKDFDLLIYTVEHSDSVAVLQYIIKEVPYENLNYAFFDTGKYKNAFVSVFGHRINTEQYKTPLFSAVANNKFRMADVLLGREEDPADINYRINEGDYHQVDILNYLYSLSSFRDILNHKNLKYILQHGYRVQNLSAPFINKLINSRDQEGILGIILKHCLFDNQFIVRILMLSRHQVALSTPQIQRLVEDEKKKLVLDESVYDNADNNENYDAFNWFLDYDVEEDLDQKIEDYELLERAVEYNKMPLVQKILAYYDRYPLKQPSLENALQEASKNINVDILNLLLDRLKSQDSKDPKDPSSQEIDFEKVLLECSRYHHIHYRKKQKEQHKEIMKRLVEFVLHLDLDKSEGSLKLDSDLLNHFSPSYFIVILNIAIKMGHFPLVQALLSQRQPLDINVKDGHDEYPLVAAYHANQMNIFHYLLENGAKGNILVKEKDTVSLLSLAIQNKNYMAVKYLLAYSSLSVPSMDKANERESNPNETKENQNANDFNSIDNYGFTPLVVSYLIDPERKLYQETLQTEEDIEKINEFDANGYSVLHYALLCEDLPNVSRLIELGAEVGYTESNQKRGNSALDIALSIQNQDLIQLLLHCPSLEINRPNWRGETNLITAIKLIGNLSNVENFDCLDSDTLAKSEVKVPTTATTSTPPPTTTLSSSASSWTIKDIVGVMQLLLAHGADVNYVDTSHNTPLIYAVQEGSKPVIQLLLDHGADVNFQGAYDITPLMVAVEKGNLAIVDQLVTHGAEINYYIDNNNQSLIMYAVTLGQLDIFKYFIDRMSFNDLENERITPTSSKDPSLTKINQQDKTTTPENTPDSKVSSTGASSSTTSHSNPTHVDVIPTSYFNLGQLSQFYEFMEALRANHQISFYEAMAERHLSLMTRPALLNTIISQGRLDLLKILRKYGMDVNQPDDQGNIPLSYAIQWSEPAIVSYLVSEGANIYHVNGAGQTIYELCGEVYDPNNSRSQTIQAKIKRLISNDHK